MTALLVAAVLASTPVSTERSFVERLHVRAELFAGDIQPLNLGILAGTETFLLSLYAGAGRDQQFVAGAGLGLHLGNRLWLEPTASCSIIQALSGAQETDLLMQLRVLIGVQAFERLGFFLGPTGNVQLSFAPNPIIRGSALNPLMTVGQTPNGGGWQFWVGLQAGVRI